MDYTSDIEAIQKQQQRIYRNRLALESRNKPSFRGGNKISKAGNTLKENLKEAKYQFKKGTRFLGSKKKGGKIKETGLYKLHKGEKVVPRYSRISK